MVSCGLLHNRDTILAYYASCKKISPSELVSNGYISNHNEMRRPRPKFKVSFYLYFCCFWINVTQINFENIKRKIQRIISDSCFQLKSWFNVDARAPSIPLLNFPFKTRFHNFFPPAGQVMNEHNPPMMLPNGYVYGEKVRCQTALFVPPSFFIFFFFYFSRIVYWLDGAYSCKWNAYDDPEVKKTS